MSNYSNYRKSYIQTTRSYYDGDRRNLSIDRIRDDFTNTGVPYGYTAKKVSTVYRIPSRDEKREIIVNNKYVLSSNKKDNFDGYEYIKPLTTRRNRCRCCRCCNCNCHSCADNYNSFSAVKRSNQYDMYSTGYTNNLEKSYNYSNVNTNRNRGFLIEKSPPQINSYRKIYKKYEVNKYNNNKSNISPIKPVNMRYITEGNYKRKEEKTTYETKNPKKYTNYKETKNSRIENSYENNVSKDGKYVISMALSKKVLDGDDSKKKKEIDREKEKGKYRNNYYREEIEEGVNGGERELTERKSTLRSRLRDLGDNYKYFERVENKSPLKATITRQKRRQPIHVYGNEYYETNEEVNKYKYYPTTKNKKVTRYYKQEDGEYENNTNNNKRSYIVNQKNNYKNNDYDNDKYKKNDNAYYVTKKYEKYVENDDGNYGDNNNDNYRENDDGNYDENNNENYDENDNGNYEENNNQNYEEYHEEQYRENNEGNYEDNDNDNGNYEENNNYEENDDGNYDENSNDNYEKVEKYEYTNYYGY